MDLEVNSSTLGPCNLQLLPFLAVRLSWINQNIKSFYQDDLNNTRYTDECTNTQAYGFMVGFDSRYFFRNNINLITRAAIGSLYGKTDYSLLSTADTIPKVNTFGDSYNILFSSELSTGIEWYICNIFKQDVTFSFGYELHTWYGIKDTPTFPNFNSLGKITMNKSSLLFHGLFVRIDTSF